MKSLMPALLLIGVAACGPGAVTSHALTGTLTLKAGDSRTPTCEGTGGYSDIHPGTQLTVKDEAGVIVGSGTLGAATSPADTRYPCEYPFTISEVGAAKFYSVEVSKRGALTYSAADMDKMGWKVSLTLGD
jgi:hypothetical protein